MSQRTEENSQVTESSDNAKSSRKVAVEVRVVVEIDPDDTAGGGGGKPGIGAEAIDPDDTSGGGLTGVGAELIDPDNTGGGGGGKTGIGATLRDSGKETSSD